MTLASRALALVAISLLAACDGGVANQAAEEGAAAAALDNATRPQCIIDIDQGNRSIFFEWQTR